MSTTLKLPDAGQLSSVQRLVPVLRFAALVVLLVSASVVEAVHLQSLGNAMSWLQLQVGSWIIAHRTVPHSGILSQASDFPWADPNWGLQLPLAVFSRFLGMRAIPSVVMFLRLLFALATFILAGGRRGNFWLAILVSLWAQLAVSSSSVPAATCSAILFSLELLLLLRSSASRRPKLLYWIPLLILVWVNLDWRFMLGVITFCFFCGAAAVDNYLQTRNWRFDSSDERARLGLAGGLTGIASLLSPNSYHSYVTAWQNLFGAPVLKSALATASLTFREPQHYLLMGLAMCTFLLLGRQHARDLFLVVLLAASVSLGFALGSEAWVIAVSSVAVIGEFVLRVNVQPGWSTQISVTGFRLAVAVAAVVSLIAAMRIPSSPESLLTVMANRLPVRACDFIRKNRLPGPIYNEMEWGGFLVWYLPDYPVAIDDRYELYGETITERFYAVTSSQVQPSSDKTLTASNTILLSVRDSIVLSPDMFPNREEIFRLSFPGFQEVYRDDLAVVLTKQQ